MKLGVFTVLFAHLPFDQMVEKVAELGFDCIELGTGAYPGNAHCDAGKLLADKAALREFRRRIDKAGLSISALSCHGNPLHPNARIARQHHADFEQTVRLAQHLEVSVINVLSGCPGDSPKAKYPNWITCAWPPDYPQVLEWQWREVVVPYWKRAATFARKHGIERIAVEMHPGFVVYNPETALKLRELVGPQIGVNFDPSHLFWLGIDIPTAIRSLGNSIFHCHAKDTRIDTRNVSANGVLSPLTYDRVQQRPWTFRTVGWGHDLACWREIVTELRLTGYDYVMSIEHEDPLISIDEGLRHATDFLREVILRDEPAKAWWM